jgi:trans-2,3-dihydro-3-hydroxyanthranilate isomerase
MTASYDFVQLDVLPERRSPAIRWPFSPTHGGLTDKQMQALAREMNLSETTFILPREAELEATDGTRVRIFTTREELPFAGHPTLGTALYL